MRAFFWFILLLCLFSGPLSAVNPRKSCAASVSASDLSESAAATWRQFRRVADKNPPLAEFLLPSEVLALLADRELPRYGQNLQKLLDLIAKNRSTADIGVNLSVSLKKLLEDQVPASTIESRIWKLAQHQKGALVRALGDNSLKEIQRLFHGGNPLSPTSDSWLGKYLAETGAYSMGIEFQMLGTNKYGPNKLVVAVSEQSFPTFVKYFQREELVTIVGHAMLNHNNRVKGIQFSDFRFPHMNSILPYVLLKTTEAQRLTQYFDLFEKIGGHGWGQAVDQPWKLEGYCAQSGYHCCTQWIGNMPIGDTLVDRYAFPGRVENNERPRSQRLRPYELDDELTHRVWKVPGNQQFADLLGQKAANLRGEFASTGWVYETLLSRVSVDRVPVVFWITEDHKAKFDEDFPMQYEDAH